MSISILEIKKRQSGKNQSENSMGEEPEPQKVDDEEEKYEFDMVDQELDDLDKYLVPGTETVYYIPNYVTQNDHDIILKALKEKPGWKELPRRIVKKFGGDVTSEGLANKEELPDYLQPLAQRIYDDFIISSMPNHMLVNGYSPTDGIMPHTDGPAYHPEVACLNLGANSLLSFWKNQDDVRESKYLARVYCEPRSLVIFTDKYYSDYLHGIEYVHSDKMSTFPVKNSFLTPTNPLCTTPEDRESYIDNWKSLDTPIGEGVIEKDRQDVRYSITVRHVFEKSLE